ncbi:hypothetical protein [Maribacter litoralis]|uniref:hypothetical protein n=1 Tax=Maribacter litoralis TaxID=2059726 RepID=UPI003F5CD1DE
MTNPLGKGYLFGYMLVILLFFKKKFIKENLDLNFSLILIFSLSYALFYAMHPSFNTQTFLWYFFFPPCLYLWGKYLVIRTRKYNFTYLLLSLGITISIVALISVFLDINRGGFVQPNRNIPFFWSTEPIPATGMAALLTFNMCIPGIVLTNYKNFKKSLSAFLIIIFLLSFTSILRLGSRTQIAIFLITTIITVIYIIPKQNIKQNFILFIIIGIVFALVINKVSFDTNASWLNSFATRLEGNRSTISNAGGRSQRWSGALMNIFKKPLGWELEEYGYIHNVWLDVLRVSGIIPFVMLIIFSVRFNIIVKKTISFTQMNLGLKVTILTFTISMFLLFMVEPVIDGSLMLFLTFCMFNGMIYSNYINLKNS